MKRDKRTRQVRARHRETLPCDALAIRLAAPGDANRALARKAAQHNHDSMGGDTT